MKKILTLLLCFFSLNNICLASAYTYPQYIEKAKECYIKNNFNCAHLNLQRAKDLQPNKMKPHSLDGLVYLKEKKFFDAVWEFDQALKIEPNDVTSLTGRGSAKCFNEDYKGAIADFTKSLALDPNQPNIWALKSYANFTLDNKKEALKDAEQAIKLAPNSPIVATAYIVRGTIKKNKSDLDLANRLSRPSGN